MFRKVPLPEGATGKLLLHSMPGWHEPTEVALRQVVAAGVNEVICLAPRNEIRETAPAYAQAIACGLPWKHTWFEVDDFTTGDERAFEQLARDIGNQLQNGETILIHCGAGIGRSGTLAIAVLIFLGMAPGEASQRVKAVGSYPETDEQIALLVKLALMV